MKPAEKQEKMSPLDFDSISATFAALVLTAYWAIFLVAGLGPYLA